MSQKVQKLQFVFFSIGAFNLQIQLKSFMRKKFKFENL